MRDPIWSRLSPLTHWYVTLTRSSLTIAFPSPASEDAATLQGRLSTLSTLHAQATQDLALRDSELRAVQDRLSDLAQSSAASATALAKRAEEAERELRWAKEGRATAERREQLARDEADALRDTQVCCARRNLNQLTKQPVSSSETPSADQSAQVAQLQRLVKTYRAELDAMARDSRETEAALTAGAGLVKISELESAQERIAALEASISAFDSTISELTAANTTLDAEVNDLMRRVASGEYNPTAERCLELSDNPAARVHAVRRAELDGFKAENEALLRGKGESVPKESWERAVKEKEEVEAAYEKRLQRLREVSLRHLLALMGGVQEYVKRVP